MNKKETRDTVGTAENPARPQILLCVSQNKILLTDICITYISPTTQNLSDLDFDLSRFEGLIDIVMHSSYMISYHCLVVTHSLTGLLYEMQALKI